MPKSKAQQEQYEMWRKQEFSRPQGIATGYSVEVSKEEAAQIMEEHGLEPDPEYVNDPAKMWDEFDDDAPGFDDLQDLSQQFKETIRLRQIEYLLEIEAEHDAITSSRMKAATIITDEPVFESLQQDDTMMAESSTNQAELAQNEPEQEEQETRPWTPDLPHGITLVKLFRTDVAVNDDESRPDAEDDQDTYEVDWIAASGYKRGRGKQVVLRVLVKWKGYPVEEATWEALEMLGNACELPQDEDELIDEVRNAAENAGLNLCDESATASTAQK